MSDEQDGFREAAEAVYQELLARVGEAQPEPRLDATRRAVELLGDPHRSAPVIQIAGTNGKTSTSRMIASLLRAAGLRPGLLTSPHLQRVTERIVIDGEPISDEAFAAAGEDVRPYLLMVDAELTANGEPPLTFFEALTVLAFAAFADAPVDVMVLEVGLGGEWDCTNVADAQVAVFTPIALDHMDRLGATIELIARTKSGIIKPASSVVTANQRIEALDELRAAAAQDEASIAIERSDFAVESSAMAVGGQLLDLRGIAGRYEGVFLPLYGDHQAQNAAVAVAAVETFLGEGTRALDLDVVVQGLAEADSPGRLQLVGVEPSVFVDAAHNPHGAASLAAAMQEYFDFAEIALVLGVLRDKDAHGIVRELAPIAARIHATRSESERAIGEEELAEIAGAVAGPDAVVTFARAEDALDEARAWAAAEPRRAVVVTGSITLVGEAIALAEAGGWK
ncbi:bifunctional folylpolyglutamate synthase/dihydrofolate synthase [Homoserinibacter sp. YIM 151385]|uniref:bifunctional folylpolyglutamate synthase/dihydrofolate synthase n=1 Tax=Homoserinibacter sp. YIM 151385 TaxID=2985506 RepID=UPI0022F0BCD9|nr:folylpolyglutamate synthase/dihydrofolate synthase family protein [Homoserinibacter sp. YIM 151385]WBU38992.1 bifunctional folylpolyglutamate synthase/dihydrofolate synthase [Homoserinibacter sp. YIM 151385]